RSTSSTAATRLATMVAVRQGRTSSSGEMGASTGTTRVLRIPAQSCRLATGGGDGRGRLRGLGRSIVSAESPGSGCGSPARTSVDSCIDGLGGHEHPRTGDPSLRPQPVPGVAQAFVETDLGAPAEPGRGAADVEGRAADVAEARRLEARLGVAAGDGAAR